MGDGWFSPWWVIVSRSQRWKRPWSGKAMKNAFAPAATRAFSDGSGIVRTTSAALTSKTASLRASLRVRIR
jgi:hypothetical protein